MEKHSEKSLLEAFNTTNLYEILSLSREEANEDTIKRQYRRLALVNHPDKGGSTIKFNAISIAYQILSNHETKRIYDESGVIASDDELPQNFDYWYQFYRNLFPKITINDIDKFKSSYIDSKEEYEDVIDSYNNYRGSMKTMKEVLMFVEDDDDEMRIIGIIDKAIKEKVIKPYPNYQKYREGAVKSTKRRKMSSKSAKESNESLVQAILSSKSNKSSSILSSIMSKYGEDEDGFEDIPDDEFEALQRKVVNQKASSSSSKPAARRK